MSRHESPYLTTREAAEYLRYQSTAGIRQAVRRGQLVPIGRGPRNTHLFTRTALDGWVRARQGEVRLATPNQVVASGRTENLAYAPHHPHPALYGDGP